MPNRLAAETSPYLLQHADNPVDWYPWGEEALDRARAEDKPILVSIGYAACHWCHVMERECFEDPQIAALMNERFVCIKVDREERPDVDAIYMDAVQAMTGRGGWPLNAFLTPDGAPVLRRHLLPARAAPGDAVLAAGRRRRRRGVARPARRDRRDRPADPPAPRRRRRASPRPRASRTRPRSTRAVTLLRPRLRPGARRLPDRRAEVPARLGDRVPARARRARDGAAHAARDGGGGDVRPDRRRLRALQRRRPLGDPPLREDALRQRAARARVPARVPGVGRAALRARLQRDARLGAARPAPGGGRLRVRARRGLRGRGGEVLRLDARRDARRARRRRGGALAYFGLDRPPNFEGSWAPVRRGERPRAPRRDQAAAARGARGSGSGPRSTTSG